MFASLNYRGIVCIADSVFYGTAVFSEGWIQYKRQPLLHMVVNNCLCSEEHLNVAEMW